MCKHAKNRHVLRCKIDGRLDIVPLYLSRPGHLNRGRTSSRGYGIDSGKLSVGDTVKAALPNFACVSSSAFL